MVEAASTGGGEERQGGQGRENDNNYSVLNILNI